MRNILLTLFIVLSVCACVGTSNQVSPYETYKTFVNTIEDKDYNSAVDMFSHERRNNELKETPPSELDNYFRFLSAHTTIANETVHYQKIGLFKACLTINGFTEDNEPTTVSFKFLNEKGDWKLDYIQTFYHKSKDEFPETATCPIEQKF